MRVGGGSEGEGVLTILHQGPPFTYPSSFSTQPRPQPQLCQMPQVQTLSALPLQRTKHLSSAGLGEGPWSLTTL